MTSEGQRSKHLYVVDDNPLLRRTITDAMTEAGYSCQVFRSGDHFLDAQPGLELGAILLDVRMPGRDGMATLRALRKTWPTAPVLMMSGQADIPIAVQAMKIGATDFVEKPVTPQAVKRMLTGLQEEDAASNDVEEDPALKRLETLSDRENQVLSLLAAGRSNKEIARELGISHRTVEIHRSRMRQRLGVNSLAELLKLVMKRDLQAG